MNRSASRYFDKDMLASILCFLCALFLLSFAEQVFAINISPQSLSVKVGSNATVTVSETRGTVTVSSSAPSIATVTYASGKATITGLSVGSATVRITNRGDNKQVRVTVTPALTVSPTTVSIPAGGNFRVSVSNSSGTVRVSSSNSAVATVSYASGLATIRGVAAGSASITIADSFNSRTVAVTVTQPLAVSPTAVSVSPGGNVTVNVSNATGSVSALSSNTAIATVSYTAGTATIHGIASGSASITIADSFNSRTVAVTVTQAQALTVSPSSIQLTAGSNASVTVTNATGTVTASSSNTSVATVVYAAGTATVRGVAAGSATITIADRLNRRQVAVTVSAVARLTVTPTSVIVPVGNDAAVSVTNASGTVSVSSSNTSVATVSYVSGTATIHGVAAGSASISVRDSQSTRTVATSVVGATASNFTLLAWNNLGMHCFDGVDYSIFSILPPLNTLLAQLQNKAGALVTSGVTITYEATADTRGSINSSSANKTNFWQYVKSLFGATLPPDMGLLGFPMASSTPAAMRFNTERGWYEAPGIPITNHDDSNSKNEYPMVKVVAKNTAGQVLATTNVVLPVSDELMCSTCHTSNVGSNAAANAARPATGWVFDNDPLKDWKKNILRLHDEKQSGNAVFANALKTKGYTNGLLNSANAGTPVLCASCHVSNAYQVDAGVATGIPGISSLTSALHTLHGKQIDPASGLALDDVNNRNTCYMCHPGSTTQCLRGAMSGPATQCQSCHGNMSKVGEATRQGWLDEPTCQACHNSSKRNASAVDANGNPLLNIADQTFATTPNQPSAGFNLYRFSTGHGGVKCEACHGATHAEYPSLEANDNVQSIAVQGHAGTVSECTTCHQTVPTTANGGPHGMHSIGNQWVSQHHDLIGSAGGTGSCAYCHGANFRGSFLSAVKMPKTFSVEGRTVSYSAGQQVSCYDCHNGPNVSALTGKTRLASIESSASKGLAFNLKEYLNKFSMLGAGKNNSTVH